ncbi:MAG: hypothetical protein GY756_10980 [bacterium]|nr:hypothetical protein [bacterium]
MSCKKDKENLLPIGFEVSGSSFDGIYKQDATYTKGIKYVNQADDSEYIKDYTDDDVEMWGLHKVYSKSIYLYYKIEKDGIYPPESGWRCGVGVDKPKFKCTPIYE